MAVLSSSTQTQWDNPFIHSCEWVSVRSLSEVYTSLERHSLVRTFYSFKILFKNGYFEKDRSGREYFPGQALSSRQI